MCRLIFITYHKLFIVVFLMIRRPPRSTRTDTPVPDTTLFRSEEIYAIAVTAEPRRGPQARPDAISLTIQDVFWADRPEINAARDGSHPMHVGTRSSLDRHTSHKLGIDIHLPVATLMPVLPEVLAHAVDHHVDAAEILHAPDIDSTAGVEPVHRACDAGNFSDEKIGRAHV